ncbi:MAG: response regulator [Nitriliruptorales bacterium]|nr:response regulator [Nitriliruptorales bacterium]
MNDAIRVLVAEDNEDHLFFIVRALREVSGVGFEIDAVRDGEEALDFVHRRGRFADRPRPHMILLDIKMPKISGLEVLKDLKQHPELRQIPITVLSSSDRAEDIDEAYRLGTNTYLVKNMDIEGLKRDLADAKEYWTETARLPRPPQ